MSMTQLFRKPIENSILFDLLAKICKKTDKFYIIDLNAYKKMLYHELHVDFCNSLMEYYHYSKQFYLTRKLTYNYFTNIIRQLCKSKNIMFTSNIKYNESNYGIEYYIYYTPVHI
jgi:hypothetical protein